MPISEITPHLFIGTREDTKEIEELEKRGIDLIINAILFSSPTSQANDSNIKIFNAPSIDTPLTLLPMSTLKRAVEAALPAIRNNKNVLVYCVRGRHRSVVIACCILIALGYSSEDAMKLVMQKREVADPYAWYVKKHILKFERIWNENEI